MFGRPRKLLLGIVVGVAFVGPAVASAGPFSWRPDTTPPRAATASDTRLAPSPAPTRASTADEEGTATGALYAADPELPGRLREIAEVEARAAAEAARAEAAAAEAARYAGIFPSVDYWLRIHQCEQPDSWSVHGKFGNGLMGGGGLGLSDGAWAAWGGLQYATHAGAADPLDQMRVASVGYRMYGAGPWGCK